MARTIDRILFAIKKFSSEDNTTISSNNITTAHESYFDTMSSLKVAIVDMPPNTSAIDNAPFVVGEVPQSNPATDKMPQSKSKPAMDKIPQSKPAMDKMPQSKPAVDKIPPSKLAMDKMPQYKPAMDNMPQSKPVMDKMPQSKPVMDKMLQSKPVMDKMPQSKPVMDKIPPSRTSMATVPSFKSDLSIVQRSKIAMAIIAKNKSTVNAMHPSMSTSAMDTKPQSMSAANPVVNFGREQSFGSSPCVQDQLFPPLASLDGNPGQQNMNKYCSQEIMPVVIATEPPKKLYLGRFVIKKSKNVSLSIEKDPQCQILVRATSTSESESSHSSSSSANSSPSDSILSKQPYFFEKGGSNTENVPLLTCSKRTGDSVEDGNEAKRRRLSDTPANQQSEVGEQFKQSKDKLSPKFHNFKNLLRNLAVVKRLSAGRGERSKRILSQDMESELLNTAKWAQDFTRRSYGYTNGFVDSHCRVDELVVCLNRDKAFHTDRFTLPINVDGFIAAFTNPRTFAPKFIAPDDELLKLALNQDGVWVTLGCPPQNATYFYDAHERSLEEVVSSTARVVALGPCGLDYTIATVDSIQRFVFKAQVRVAAKLNAPLVVECREAEDDVIAILQRKIHLQGFTGDMILANRWLSHYPNVYFGLSPAVGDVSASRSVKEMVASIPLNRILLESGASQTVPEAFRKVVSTAHFGFALFAAKAVGELRKLSTEAVLKACRDNTRQMYGI